MTFEHTSPYLTLRFRSTLDEDGNNESLGLNDLEVIYCNSGLECISDDFV